MVYAIPSCIVTAKIQIKFELFYPKSLKKQLTTFSLELFLHF